MRSYSPSSPTAGNKYRERMATMMQEDLQKIGIKVNVVTLDFPSLIERMTQKFDYEAILLGFTQCRISIRTSR